MSPPVPDPREGTTSVPEPVEGTEGSTGQASRRSDELRDRSHPSPLPLVLLAVFAAGMLGTAARLGLDAAMPTGPGGIPLSTLLINTVGSFALGLLVSAIPHSSPEWLRAGVTTGLLGSFTTFSALTVAAAELSGRGEVLPAAALLILSVVAGIGAAVAGMAIGAATLRRRG